MTGLDNSERGDGGVAARRRNVVSVIGAVVVLAAVTVVILVFGVIPIPEFPSLAAQPDPVIPGTIAYVVVGVDSCIMTVPASGGTPKEMWCTEYADVPAWTPEGLLAVKFWPYEGREVEGNRVTDYFGEPVYLLIDPVTGTEIDRVAVADQVNKANAGQLAYPPKGKQEREDGATVRIEGNRSETSEQAVEETGRGLITAGEEVIVRLPAGENQAILSVGRAPSHYGFSEAQWSPDGQWVLVSDTEGRLLIIGADGTPEARVLVDGSQGSGVQAAWYIPGYDTPGSCGYCSICARCFGGFLSPRSCFCWWSTGTGSPP